MARAKNQMKNKRKAYPVTNSSNRPIKKAKEADESAKKDKSKYGKPKANPVKVDGQEAGQQTTRPVHPAREDLLKHINERKAKAVEEKAKRRLDVSNKQAQRKLKNRKRKLNDVASSAERRAEAYNQKVGDPYGGRAVAAAGVPVELSRKSYFKEFKKVVDASDVVIQVLDARDPLGCRCKEIEELVMSSGANKKLVLLLNKIDLIPRKVVESWLKYLRNEFPAVAFKASTQSQRNKLSQSKVRVDAASADLLQSNVCLGAGTLLKLLGNYTRVAQTKQMITVGVVGFPNVGKSSVINSLKRSKACVVGNTPGVTKNMQEIQLDKHVKLLDSPGIIMATGNNDTQVILRNAVKIEQLDDPIAPVEAILNRCNKNDIMDKYQVPDYQDAEQFLASLALRMGKLRKGGIPDTVSAAKCILQDWNNGRISFYTHPPERAVDTEHNTAKVVQYFGAGFDLKQIEAEEQSDLNDLMDALGSALVIDPSKPGLMDVEAAKPAAGEKGDVDDDDDDDDEHDTGKKMDEGSDQLLNNVVVVKKRKTENKSAAAVAAAAELAEWCGVAADANNLQSNQQKKKKFKKRQKNDRKQEQRLLAEDALASSRTDEDGDCTM